MDNTKEPNRIETLERFLLDNPELDRLRTPFYTYNKLRKFLWYICIVKEDCCLPSKIVKKIAFKNFDAKRDSINKYYYETKHTIRFIEFFKENEINECGSLRSSSKPSCDRICHTMVL
jgi:hypothetical protein